MTAGRVRPATTGATQAFAMLLNQWRTRSGLSYSKVGRLSFMSASTVHRYCTGAATPADEDVVVRLGRACGADPQEIDVLVREWRDASALLPDPSDLPDPPARRRWPVVAALTTIAVLVVVGAVVAFSGLRSSSEATEGSGCRGKADVYHADGVTGSYHHVWTHDVTCTTAPKAAVYADHTPRSALVGTMVSTETWLVCWVDGAPGPGGNRLWFYTQGDYSRPDQRQRHAWGFISAADVRGHPREAPHDLEECPGPTLAPSPTGSPS